MIAEVIVDVPARSVDRPFDYFIPTKYQEAIAIGSRVQVPFGSRQVLGYVIRIKEQTERDQLKEISKVMDLTPPLTDELVDIGLRMSDEYLCHPITAFQAMVPSVLKGKYQKWIQIHPEMTHEELQHFQSEAHELVDFLQQEQSCLWEQALTFAGVTERTLRKWIAEKKISVREQVSDRVTHQKVRWVVPEKREKLEQALQSLSLRKKKQREIVQFFLEHHAAIRLSDLLTKLGTTRSTVKLCVNQQWLRLEDRIEWRDPYRDQSFQPSKPLPLTDEQQQAFASILDAIRREQHETMLLHGVTGSGKTEIYLQAISHILQKGKEAIVLVPEISLTPQMVRRFKERLGSKVAVLHSGLSKGERFDEWQRIRKGESPVVIGARSAIFAPFSQIGLIIIDEEHESSYKQEENPKYHARTIAKWRAEKHQAVLILGSATPAVETYCLARTGQYRWLPLRKRVNQLPYPTVQIVDMRREMQRGNRSIFSQPLSEQLEACVKRGEQAVLFLNRRGFSTFVMCRECGEALQCPSCDISLTFHQSNGMVRCHYCGYGEPLPGTCPSCGSRHIRHFGIGTQRVEEELHRHFPDLRVIRMDVDTTQRKGAHQRLLSKFAEGKADVLLGTQMIAKGLDFPKVTLVGVITADTVLHLPDFRAAERTFQLLTQVSGRAGRHEQQGHVVIQTYHSDHYSIQLAANHQIASFYRQELILRKKHRYPPFCGLFHLLLTHLDREQLFQLGQTIATQLRSQLPEGCQLLGPVPAMIPRIKNRFRSQIMIKYNEDKQTERMLKEQLRSITAQFVDKDLQIRVSREGTSVS